MTHNDLHVSRSWEFRPLVLCILCAFSNWTGAEEPALDSALLNYSRSSLNLGLCSVVFDEEFGDNGRADRYQAGSERAERLIREGGWTEEEVLLAHDAVLQHDFSFTLPPDMSWSSFRRARFTRDFCDRTLAQVAGQAG